MSDATILLRFAAEGEARLQEAVKRVAAEMRAAEQITLKVAKAMRDMEGTEDGARLATHKFNQVLSQAKK